MRKQNSRWSCTENKGKQRRPLAKGCLRIDYLRIDFPLALSSLWCPKEDSSTTSVTSSSCHKIKQHSAREHWPGAHEQTLSEPRRCRVVSQRCTRRHKLYKSLGNQTSVHRGVPSDLLLSRPQPASAELWPRWPEQEMLTLEMARAVFLPQQMIGSALSLT